MGKPAQKWHPLCCWRGWIGLEWFEDGFQVLALYTMGYLKHIGLLCIGNPPLQNRFKHQYHLSRLTSTCTRATMDEVVSRCFQAPEPEPTPQHNPVPEAPPKAKNKTEPQANPSLTPKSCAKNNSGWEILEFVEEQGRMVCKVQPANLPLKTACTLVAAYASAIYDTPIYLKSRPTNVILHQILFFAKKKKHPQKKRRLTGGGKTVIAQGQRSTGCGMRRGAGHSEK